MNPEQMLTYISKVIEHRQPMFGRAYYIGVWKRILDVRPTKQKPFPGKIFMKVDGRTLQDGLTDKQWDSLRYKVAVYFKYETDILERERVEDTECQKTPKP